MTKKRIALLTTWFPPNNGVAVNRMKAFAEYLSYDFEIEVFTIGNSTDEQVMENVIVHTQKTSQFWDKAKHNSKDSKFIHNIKSLINVVASKFKISKLKAWEKSTLKNVESAHKNNPFDVVLSSYAPIEVHNIACSMKKKYSNLFWVADMRDEMSDNPFGSETEKIFLQQKEKDFEKYIDAITTVSEPILKSFKNIFSDVKVFEEVRNGFDHTVEPIKSFNEIFTFVYAGTFYGKNKPTFFLEVLNRLIVEGKIKQDFRIKFIGTSQNFSIPKILTEHCVFLPKVNYSSAIEEMRMADCNLLFSVPINSYGRFTGKLFDYLSVEKPILALVDLKDVGAELINEHKSGFAVDFYDESEIEKAILAVFELWKNKEFLPIDSSKTIQLHRKFQVEKLSKMIFKLLEE